MNKYKYYDNLFNADHRRAMIERYGYTEAEFVTIEELLFEELLLNQ